MEDWSKFGKKKIFHNGKDFYFYDLKGDKYLDGISNMWCNVWGFNNNPITEGMKKQIDKVPHSTIFGVGNLKSIDLANRMIRLSKGMHKVFFTDNGSSAIEVALKISIQYWKNKGSLKRNSFLSLKDGYHGDTFGAMSVGYVDKYFHSYKSMLIKCVNIPKPKFYKFNKSETDPEILKILVEKIEKILERNYEKTNALIMESGAQIAGGVTIYPKYFQKKISELCKKYDIIFILDEIATGFGRLGNMIEYISQDSIPDIVCFGKAITGGYFPLALTLASKKVYDEFKGEYNENKQLFHGHTFAGHPVGCAAVIENLKLYKERKLLDKIRKNSNLLEKRLKEFEKLLIVENVRSKGLLGGFEIIKNKKPIRSVINTPISYYITKEGLKRKILLRSLGNTMVLIPPLAIDNDLLDRIIDAQYEIVQNIQKNV